MNLVETHGVTCFCLTVAVFISLGIENSQGGDAAAVRDRLTLLHNTFAEEVGEEGSGTFTSPKTVQEFVSSFAKRNGLKNKDLMFPARVALTGSTQGGSFYEMIFLLGRAETLRRLQAFEDHVNEYVFEHTTATPPTDAHRHNADSQVPRTDDQWDTPFPHNQLLSGDSNMS